MSKLLTTFLIGGILWGNLAAATRTVELSEAIITINGTSGDSLGYTTHYLGDQFGPKKHIHSVNIPFQDKDISTTDTGKIFLFELPSISSNNLTIADSNRGDFEGSATDEETGLFMAGNGDIDGDSYNDFIFLHPNLNEKQVTFLLSKNNYDSSILSADADHLSGHSDSSLHLPQYIDMHGDLNGDGYHDIAIGSTSSSDSSDSSGTVALIFGRSNLNDIINGNLIDVADLVLEGSSSEEHAGYSVSFISDINQDGYDELLIGSYDDSEKSGTKAYLFYGHPQFVSENANNAQTLSLSNADAIFNSKESGEDGFGASVVSLGDINGDDYGDFAIGAPNANNDAGAIYIYYGRESRYAGNYTNAYATVISSANSYYLGHHSILGEVDLNGDLTHDLVIGAFMSQANESGSVHVITNNTTLSGPVDLNTIQDVEIINRSGLSDKFGYRLTHGGDNNEDGIHDLMVSAPGFGNNNGLVSVFELNSQSTVTIESSDNISLFSDSRYTSTVSSLPLQEWLYIEVAADTADNDRANIAQLTISSSVSTQNITLRLLESSEGIYRGKVKLVGARSSEIAKQIRAEKGGSISIQSKANNSFSQSLSINNALPSINQLHIEQTGTENAFQVPIYFQALDPDSDTLSFEESSNQVQYSLDNGNSWTDATLKNDSSSIFSNDVGVSYNRDNSPLVWDSATDIGESEGLVQLRLKAYDGSHYSSDYVYSNTLEIDNSSPDPPIISTANTKYAYSIQVSGNAEADSILELYVSDSLAASTTVSSNGKFLFTNITVSESNNTLTAIARDNMGFTSPSSNTVTLSFGEYSDSIEQGNYDLEFAIPLTATNNERDITLSRIATPDMTVNPPSGYSYVETFSLLYDNEDFSVFSRTVTINLSFATPLSVTTGVIIRYYNPDTSQWQSTDIDSLSLGTQSISFRSPYLGSYMIGQLSDLGLPQISNININGSAIADYAYYSNAVEITATLTDSEAIASYSIQLLSDSDNSVIASDSDNSLSQSSVALSLSPSNLSQDDYSIVVKAWDSSDNFNQKSSYFRVNRSQFLFDILHGPNPYNPNAGNLVFGYNSSIDLDILTITLFDQAGTIIWDTSKSNITAGYHTLNWNGKNKVGATAVNGIYYAYCFAKSGDAIVKRRLVVAVLR